MPPVIHRPSLPVPLPLSRGGLGAITAAGGRSALGLGTAAVEDYEEGSFTATGTGFSGTPPSGTAVYVRVGKMITLFLPTIDGTSNATTFTITGVPVGLASAVDTIGFVWLFDSGVFQLGVIVPPNGSGIVTIFRDIAGTPFATSGNKVAYNVALPYMLA